MRGHNMFGNFLIFILINHCYLTFAYSTTFIIAFANARECFSELQIRGGDKEIQR